MYAFGTTGDKNKELTSVVGSYCVHRSIAYGEENIEYWI